MKTVRDSLALALVITVFASVSALGLTTQHLTDAEFIDILQLFGDNAFTAEGRIGDLMGAATFELDIGPEFGNPTQTAQYGWPNGGGVDFTLHYNSSANQATFVVDGNTLTYTPAPPFSDIFVRTRAVNQNSSIIVYDLVLDGTPVGETSSTSGPDGAQTLWIRGGSLTDGFTLTGTVVMSWSGAAPSQSRLAFQVKTGALVTVPVEGTTWGHMKELFE